MLRFRVRPNGGLWWVERRTPEGAWVPTTGWASINLAYQRAYEAEGWAVEWERTMEQVAL